MKTSAQIQIAKEMIANGVRCTKATAPKKIDYNDFKSLYNAVLEEVQAKARAKAEKALISKTAKELKIKVSVLFSVLAEAKKADMSGYRTGHSMGCYVELTVVGIEAASYDSCSNYTKSCRYKATHGSAYLNIDKHHVLALQGFECKMIGGLVTFVEKTKNKIKEAYTIVGSGSKSNYRLSLQSGYVTGNFHGQTAEECENWRAAQAYRLVESRLRERASKEDLQKRMARFVGLDHSLKAGNCRIGTENFAKKYGLNPEMGYQVGYLISLEDSSFTRRLLNL